MDDKMIRIVHRPFGNGQPYFQQPFERSPRMPALGEMIHVGAATIPNRAAETMHVAYRTTYAERTNIIDMVCIGEGDAIGNDEGPRWWSAVLPPALQPTELSYRFKVCTGEAEEWSPWYSCTIGDRWTAGPVEGWTDEGERGVVVRSGAICIRFVNKGEGPLIMTGNASAVLNRSERADLWRVGERGDHLRLDGHSTIVIDLQRCTFGIEEDGVPIAAVTASPEITERCDENGRMLHYTSLVGDAPEGERYVGFGERFNAVDQRGNIVLNRVFEQYKDQRLKSYLPMPFFMTNNRWGLYVDTDHLVEFDLASRLSDQWRVTIESSADEPCVISVLLGPPATMRRAFVERFGRPPEVPSWALGPWMSSNDWNSQQLVEQMVASTTALDIPATALVIEAWSDETTFYIFNDARYEAQDAPFAVQDFTFPADGRWPDPKAMVDSLRRHGIRTVLWQIPVLRDVEEADHAQHAFDRAHAIREGYVLGQGSEGLYRSRPGWFRGSLIPDFTNEQARRWWMDKRRYLLDELGIAGFKTDGGEHLWGYSITAADGRRGDELINAFPALYLQTYQEALDGEEQVLFSRAGYTQSMMTPMHWAGDQDSTWETLRRVVTAMLNVSLSGVTWFGWDIGGFSGPLPSAELYLRSAAAAAFSPVMQYHSEYHGRQLPSRDRTPWNVAEQTGDDRVIPIYRKFAKLRMRLVEYLLRQARYVHDRYEMLIRPLCCDWPDDEEAWSVWDAYLLGTDLLVAPILTEGQQSRDVYLPEGRWRRLGAEEILTGPCTVAVDVPLDTIALFLRLWDGCDHLFYDESFISLYCAQ